jgi:hypothetical protein
VAVAFVAAPDVPPEPIVITLLVPGVVAIVDVPVTVVAERVGVPVTKTSPAPPPAPNAPKPPPPPPPITATLRAVILVGVDQLQDPMVVNVKVV